METSAKQRKARTRAEAAGQYEVFGRVLLGLQQSRALDGARDVDFWVSLTGGLTVEWWGGPYAHEVAEKLVDLAARGFPSGPLEPQDLTQVSYVAPACRVDDNTAVSSHDHDTREDLVGSAWLVVGGHTVELRPCEPVGRDRVLRELFETLRVRP